MAQAQQCNWLRDMSYSSWTSSVTCTCASSGSGSVRPSRLKTSVADKNTQDSLPSLAKGRSSCISREMANRPRGVSQVPRHSCARRRCKPSISTTRSRERIGLSRRKAQHSTHARTVRKAGFFLILPLSERASEGNARTRVVSSSSIV
jgi:hypothetical protein